MGWFFIVAVVVSLIMAAYLGTRTINLFNLHKTGYFNSISKKIFWIILVIASLSFITSRLLSDISNYWFPLVANIVFSIIICFFYGIIIIDVIRLILRVIFKKTSSGYFLQSSYIIISSALFVTGLYMASYPQIAYYDVKIYKTANVEQLKVVQLTDIHISETTSKHFIQNMVNKVNQLKPDYIFITGDTLDLRLQPYLDKNLAENFAQLSSKYGTFIIFGNHEHYGIEREENNDIQSVIDAFTAGNMKVLVDGTYYDNRTGITIIGRDDLVVEMFDKTRMDLDSFLYFVDESKPIILLDHQPKNLTEPEDLGIDIMFSGHTHAGQLFPMNLVVNLTYKNPWGLYHSNEKFTSIVSSGYGLWGPPIRLMTRSEIVVTNIQFATEKE